MDAKNELLIKALDLQHIIKQKRRIIREAGTGQGLWRRGTQADVPWSGFGLILVREVGHWTKRTLLPLCHLSCNNRFLKGNGCKILAV